jgi:uncharacterized membrane protein
MYGLIALNFIIPFVMVFVGYILKKHPVKDMTSGNGYNTPTSRKSQEHWDYAQSIAPNIFIGIGKTLGLVEIVLCISLLLLNISTQTTVFAGVVVGIIFLIFGFYKTETGLVFPVPIDDIGNATFLNEDKGLLFMRYIRKFLDTMKEAGDAV